MFGLSSSVVLSSFTDLNLASAPTKTLEGSLGMGCLRCDVVGGDDVPCTLLRDVLLKLPVAHTARCEPLGAIVPG